MNSALNCDTYFSFEGLSSNNRFVSAKTHLKLRKKKQLELTDMIGSHLPTVV